MQTNVSNGSGLLSSSEIGRTSEGEKREKRGPNVQGMPIYFVFWRVYVSSDAFEDMHQEITKQLGVSCPSKTHKHCSIQRSFSS